MAGAATGGPATSDGGGRMGVAPTGVATGGGESKGSWALFGRCGSALMLSSRDGCASFAPGRTIGQPKTNPLFSLALPPRGSKQEVQCTTYLAAMSLALIVAI